MSSSCRAVMDRHNISTYAKNTGGKKILDMEEFWQFPCCWAAVDHCHIPIKCPPGGQEASKEYHNFNYRLSRARMVTEGVYGQLKGGWRVLLRKNECDRDMVSLGTLACMILQLSRGFTFKEA